MAASPPTSPLAYLTLAGSPGCLWAFVSAVPSAGMLSSWYTLIWYLLRHHQIREASHDTCPPSLSVHVACLYLFVALTTAWPMTFVFVSLCIFCLLHQNVSSMRTEALPLHLQCLSWSAARKHLFHKHLSHVWNMFYLLWWIGSPFHWIEGS